MITNLKSEIVKCKNSKYVIVTFCYKMIEVLSILGLELYSSRNNVEEIIIYYPILILPIIISLQVSFMDEQERIANEYQNISLHKTKSYLSKKIIIVIFNVIPFCLTILFVRVTKNKTVIFLSYFLLNYLISSLYMLLSRKLKMIGLSIMGFIDTLLILFTTNNVFLKLPIFLVTGPVNMIVTGKIEQIDCFSIFIWINLIIFLKKLTGSRSM